LNRFLFLVILLPVCTFAQNDYTPLRNSGSIPSDFFQFKNVATISTDSRDSILSKRDKKLFEDFQTGNNFFLYNLLNNGYILYSGPVYDYVNKVTDTLLSSDPEMRKHIKVFVTLNPSVNAFALNNGYLFINLGLIAHCQNEAQLAFVLAHEISHYAKKHVFTTYKKIETLRKKSKDQLAEELEIYNQEDFDLFRNHFSREQESEADLAGFELLKKSRYELLQAVYSLDQLNYADYPFNNTVIDKQFLENDCFTIPRTYFPDTASSIRIDEFENDTLYNHPNIGKRKQAIANLISDNSNNGNVFLFPESDFYIIRDVCRFELSRLLLYENDYIGSIYNSYLLLQQSPNSISSLYLNSCMIKSIYFIQKASNLGRIHSVVNNPKKIKGEAQKLHYLLNKATKEEVNSISLSNAWKIQSRFPQSEEITYYTNLITEQFIENVSDKRSYFQQKTADQDSILNLSYQNDSGLVTRKLYTGGKTERKKVTKKISFAPFTMCNQSYTPTFEYTFDSIARVCAIRKEKLLALAEEEANTSKRKKKKKTKDGIVHIDNVIVIDLAHYKFDLRKKANQIRYVAGNKKQDQLEEIVVMCAEKNNVTAQLLTSGNIQNLDTKLFNDRALLKQWLNERTSNKILDERPNIDHLMMQDLIRRHHTKYICFINSAGVILPQHFGEHLLSLLISFLYPPLLLSSVYEIATPNTAYFLEFTLYDLETGKLIKQESKVYDSGDRKDLIKAEFYNLFFQLTKGEK
jgi:hypothetical protein